MRDDDVRQWSVLLVHLHLRHAVERVLAGDEVSEYGMLCVEVWAFFERDEKPMIHTDTLAIIPPLQPERRHPLAAVRVLAVVSHTQQPGFVDVPPSDVLVGEFPAVDGVTAATVAQGDVTALHHEFVDDAVKGRHLVRQRGLLARAEHSEAVARVSTRPQYV